MENFLQKDLLQGHIYYLHSGQQSTHDRFPIRLADSQHPPNLSPTYVRRQAATATAITTPQLHLHLQHHLHLLLNLNKAFDFL